MECRKKKLYIALGVALAAALCLAALCFVQYTRQNSSEGYEYVVGVCQSNLIEPSQIAVYEQMRAQMQQYPNMRLVFSDAAGDSQRQTENILEMLRLEVDLLIVAPVDARAVTQAVAQAKRQVPVIVLGSKIDSEEYDMFIGPNNYEIGYQAGRYIATLFGEAPGTVLEIAGPADSLQAQEISAGFRAALERQPRVQVLETLNGEWLRDTAERRMKDFLIITPKVDVVFAHSDAMAYGAYTAAQDLRVREIRFIGVGGQESQSIEWVNDGILESTFCCNTGAAEAIDWAQKLLTGATDVPGELVFNPTLYARG